MTCVWKEIIIVSVAKLSAGGLKGIDTDKDVITWMSVAAPAQYKSQVISRSENPPAKSPRCNFFLKKLTTFFLVVALKTQAANAGSP